jgi:hypothetical protein
MIWQNWKVWALSVGALLALSPVVGAQGQPSKSDLQQMGLGGMTIVSDEEGMAVRGMGYGMGPSGYSSAKASGNSFATINLGDLGGAHSENSYNASGKNKAGGDNFSFAGVSISETSGKGNGGKPPKGGNGGYGGMGGNGSYGNKPSGGNGGYGGMGGMGGNGGYGGMGGKTTTITFTVFAGGFSHAYAH